MKKLMLAALTSLAIIAAAPAAAEAWIPPRMADHQAHADYYAWVGCALIEQYNGRPCVSAGIQPCDGSWIGGKCGSWWVTQPSVARHVIFWRNNYDGNYWTCRRKVETVLTTGSDTWVYRVIEEYGCSPVG